MVDNIERERKNKKREKEMLRDVKEEKGRRGKWRREKRKKERIRIIEWNTVHLYLWFKVEDKYSIEILFNFIIVARVDLFVWINHYVFNGLQLDLRSCFIYYLVYVDTYITSYL